MVKQHMGVCERRHSVGGWARWRWRVLTVILAGIEKPVELGQLVLVAFPVSLAVPYAGGAALRHGACLSGPPGKPAGFSTVCGYSAPAR